MSDQDNSENEFEVTEESWFSRIWKSIKGVGLGFLMFVGAFYLIHWNEGRALQTYQSLDEGLGAVVSIDASTIHDNNNEKLVHMSGLASSDEELVDEPFNLSVNALQLFRTVEMYQWEETLSKKTKEKVGGGTTTTKEIKYDKVWSAELIDSSDFKSKKSDKQNPKKFSFETVTKTAANVRLGAFTIPSDMVEGLDNSADVELTDTNIPSESKDRMHLEDDGIFVGSDPSRPEIGDMRIRFSKTPATEVTIVAQQDGDTFTPYETDAGDSLVMIKQGKLNANEMFEDAKSENSIMTWILRACAIAAMCAGLKMMLLPIAVVADFIPFVGGIMALGVSLVCGVVGVSLSLLTIGMSWVSYRPMIGIPLLVVPTIALFVLIKKRRRRSTPDQQKPAAEAIEAPATEA
jgi:hypothetical protein